MAIGTAYSITKGHSVVPGGTESSQQRGNLCAQFIKNRRSLLVPERIQKGLDAVHTECKDIAILTLKEFFLHIILWFI